ncbi:MAG: glycosyltransferase family 4 protein [Betaproteobacteria bacterium]|nr:glycosyltransferase family 4 protein [Betaproteobacteria bacterium]
MANNKFGECQAAAIRGDGETGLAVPTERRLVALAGTDSGRCVVVVTDNRFWRAQIGSQVRIKALLEHLHTAGWAVRVAFQGRPYLDDAAKAAAMLGIDVRFLLPPKEVAPAHDASTPPGWRTRVRAQAGRGLRWLRALCTQYHRARGASSLWAEVGLRSREQRVGDGADPALLELVRRCAPGVARTVVLVEYLRLAWVATALRPLLPGVTWVLDTHDVMHERQARFHAVDEAHELDVSAAEEARWLSGFDAVLAIQARDARTFADIGVRAQVLTVPHPVRAQRMPSRDSSVVGVGFLGSDMAPNRIALRELVYEVWPLVQRQARVPVRLVLAGAVCAAWRERGDLPPSVQVLGFVDDTAEFYEQVDIVASPMRVGGGLKIKNVEALCRGKALVTTAVGAEGMEPGLPHALAVVQASAEMAHLLLAWIHDPALRARRMDAGYRFALEQFDPETAFRALDRFLG